MKTRALILQEMLRHVEKFGEKRTRLVALAEDLGMSHATIYKHFKNKGEILDTIALDWLRQADEVISSEVNSSGSPKEAVISIAVNHHRFLAKKLTTEPAAIEVFRFSFTNQSKRLANHLTNLKIEIGKNVIAHQLQSKHPKENTKLILELLTTTLECYLNPILIHDRGSENDEQQVRLLIDSILK